MARRALGRYAKTGSFVPLFASEEEVDDLAGSFERTKADGENLICLRLENFSPRGFRATATVEKILRSEPNKQILVRMETNEAVTSTVHLPATGLEIMSLSLSTAPSLLVEETRQTILVLGTFVFSVGAVHCGCRKALLLAFLPTIISVNPFLFQEMVEF